MSGGGGNSGFLTNLIGRVARNAFESALNSTANSTASGMQASRSFFDLGGSDTTNSGAYQVIEYSGRKANDEIASMYPISLRAGDLILHGPRKDAESPPSSPSYLLYNIILHATNSSSSSEKMYSIFRSDSETEASRVFVIFKQIFPDLVKASSSSMDKQTIEKILKISRAHESYEAVHVASALGMTDQLKSPILRELFNNQEGKNLHVPLQVAIVHGKLDSVEAICEDDRQLNRVYDFTDIKGNNVIHLAADCKDKVVGAAVLKLLKNKLLHQSGPQAEGTKRAFLELFLKLNNEGATPLNLACTQKNIEAVKLLTTTIDELVFEEAEISMNNMSGEILSAIDDNSSTPNLPSTYLDIADPATGRTPLFLSSADPEILGELLASGSDANITDNEGVTPLHNAIVLKNLKSTLLLLSNNAYPNLKATFDTYIDATPLHIASSIGAIDCMKALIVFGADLELKDGNGHTARHIVSSVSNLNSSIKNEALFVLAAAGAKRCGLGVAGGCSDGCKSGGKNDGKKPDKWRIDKDGTTGALGSRGPPESLVLEAMRGLGIIQESRETGNSPRVREGYDNTGPVIGGRLLSLDGGGIRGLVLTQVLFFMEREFENYGSGGASIISYFDWVAGTSTGGILALALACGKSILETQSLYMKLKDKVFTGDRPYSAARMEEFLKKEFGSERKMSSIRKPKVMIMASLANRRPPDLYIFRNYLSPAAQLGEPEEYAQFPDDTYVWETAKVTGAAPSYFTLDHEVFIDGGLISNNPTLDALTELSQFKAVSVAQVGSQPTGGCNGNSWKLPSLVVSIGTGIPPRRECSATDLDIAWPTGVIEAFRNVSKVREMLGLLVDQATQAEGQVVERARAWCTTIGVPYFRFSPEMSEDIDLDEKEDDVLVNLMWETWCYMVGNRSVIREIYERLRELDVGNIQNNNDRMGNHHGSPLQMDTSS